MNKSELVSKVAEAANITKMVTSPKKLKQGHSNGHFFKRTKLFPIIFFFLLFCAVLPAQAAT